jgi:hypothetical protein
LFFEGYYKEINILANEFAKFVTTNNIQEEQYVVTIINKFIRSHKILNEMFVCNRILITIEYEQDGKLVERKRKNITDNDIIEDILDMAQYYIEEMKDE